MNGKQEFVMAEARSPRALTEGVTELLEQGWRLHGIPMHASTPVGDGSIINTFVQALVRDIE